jgi:RNA polymerase sigma-70 factor (ECF subfamily)
VLATESHSQSGSAILQIARDFREFPWGNGLGNTQIEEALKSLQSGNRQDAERALATLQGVVYGFGMKVCGSHEDAQDTAQETLIRLARQLREFPDARALSVWLYKVAKTQCLMSRRKSKFAPAQMLSLDALMPKDSVLSPTGTKLWQITPEEIVLSQELRCKLEDAVLALPKHYRLVLILRDMEQLDTREVAEVMGISEETTKMRLHRARVFVRNALAGYARQLRGDARITTQ